MAFQQGLSGLNAASKNLDVIGNNIANTATVGFKASQTQFADVYARTLIGTGGLQVGIGTQTAEVAQQFGQGNISITSNPLDIAINGNGFFRLSDGGAISYSRNGQFQLDATGFIVNSTGQRLTGYAADPTTGAIIAANPSDVQISFADLAPQATSTAGITLNLDATDTAPVAAFNKNDATTYNWSTSLTVYDSLGNSHALTMYFRKTAANTWEMYQEIDSGGTATVTSANPQAVAFNASGALTTAQPYTINATVTSGATSPLTFTLDLTGSTQYGSEPGVTSVTQNGYAAGRLSGLSIGVDGIIQGRYTNGQTRNLAQVVLANFTNPQGLQPLGNNQWAETSDSGQPLVGAPNSGTLGLVQSGAVEDSNVDLTAELVNLITAQRNFQANAQTIRTQDQVLQTLVNLR